MLALGLLLGPMGQATAPLGVGTPTMRQMADCCAKMHHRCAMGEQGGSSQCCQQRMDAPALAALQGAQPESFLPVSAPSFPHSATAAWEPLPAPEAPPEPAPTPPAAPDRLILTSLLLI